MTDCDKCILRRPTATDAALTAIRGLSANYIGMVERGEKIPALETFICIANALGVLADMLLTDVLDNGYIIKESLLAEKLDKLSRDDRERIYDVIDTMAKHATQVKP